jgi:hypothetical protein
MVAARDPPALVRNELAEELRGRRADELGAARRTLLRPRRRPAAPVGRPRRALEAEAIVYAALESALTGETVRVADVLTGQANQYEATVWEARRRIESLDVTSLT